VRSSEPVPREPAREAVPVPAAKPPMPASDGPLNVDDWTGLIERADLRGPAGQVIRHAGLIGVEGRTLRLALREEYEQMLTPTMQAGLEERLGTALGGPVKLRFERATAGVDTPAEQAARARNAQQQQAENALETDPLVQGLMREFGARVVPNSVRPAN
jgi:DNA polymerase-3 subunit gamma/tau